MRIKVDIRDHVAVLTVSGTLMSGPTVVPFQHYVEEVMADGITNVVVDFSRVRWFGSTMLGVLAVSLEMLRNAGGRSQIGRHCKPDGEFDDGRKVVVAFSHVGIR